MSLTAASTRLAGVGVFVLAGLLLFAVALFMIGDRQMAFARKFTIYTQFAKITGLAPGAIVRVAGAKAGTIKAILPPNRPSEKFKVKLEIVEDLHPLVRTDSIASIETEGLVGGTFLAVGTGSDAAPRAPENSTIAGREPFEIADLLMQMSDTIAKVNTTIDDLKDNVDRAVVSIGDMVENSNDLISDVGDDVKTMASAGGRISRDIAEITETVRSGRGTIGKLVSDDELYVRATSIARQAEEIASNTRQVVEQARQTFASLQSNLQSKDGPVQGLAADLKQTVGEARVAMSGLAENMEALKHNFLFRGFFNQRGYFDLSSISPSEYLQGALTRGGARKPVRVWLRSDVLFESSQDDGAEERPSEAGKMRLDSAIAAYLDRLGRSVMIVEGYAQEGTRDEQYLRSRARAAQVRDYLIGKFHLDPQAVGIMPLANASAHAPGGKPWDGVAIAVFLENGSK